MHIMEIINELNHNETTVVMVCHDMELVADFAQRIIVVGEGRILADDTCRRVMSQTEILKEASLTPPQIADLAIRLGKGFEDIFTLDEMTEIISQKAKKEGV